MNPDKALAEFFSAFDVKPATDDPSVIVERDLELIRQEYREARDALILVSAHLIPDPEIGPPGEDYDRLVADALKELADLVYVAVHAARSLGFDLMPVFARVDHSNKTKVCTTCGKPHRDKIGKILKTVSGYQPADILSLVRAQISESVDRPAQAA